MLAKVSQKTEAEDASGEQPRIGPVAADNADYDDYIADMILELQQMAARAGRHALAERLLAAHALARHR